jgi:hypothetical protein
VSSPGSDYLPRNLSQLVSLCWKAFQEQGMYSIVLSSQELLDAVSATLGGPGDVILAGWLV